LKKVKEIRRAEQHLSRELDRKPTREEISKYLDKSVAKIDKVLQHSVHEVSLDEPVNDENANALADCIEDKTHVSTEQRLLDRELTHGIGDAMESLNEQQQTVIGYRFGLNGAPPLTLQETGDQMSLSRERVRQIECQAKERMKKAFRRMNRVRVPSRMEAAPVHVANNSETNH